jgi:hypothetical protein
VCVCVCDGIEIHSPCWALHQLAVVHCITPGVMLHGHSLQVFRMRAMSRVLMATAVVGTTLALAGLSDAAFVLLNPADYRDGFVEKGYVYDIQRHCIPDN